MSDFPTAYVGPGNDHDGVDALVLDAQSHYVVLWTAVVGGRRCVVGIEVRAGSMLRDLDPKELEESARALDARTDLRPVASTLLRQFSFRELLAERARLVSGFGSAVEAPYSWTELRYDADSRANPDLDALLLDDVRLDYLPDASMYVAAINRGLSPRAVIAEERGIERSTADRRIAMARKFGLLTPATPRKAGGELTDLALSAIGRLRETYEKEGESDG